MTTFGLIHGANLGAWCWDFFLPELRSRGHEGVAVDLPIEDPTAGVSRYADIVVEALAAHGDDVCVLGHSFGGIVVPVVAARRPVRRMIFLAAAIPEPGRSLAEQQQHERMSLPGRAGGIENEDWLHDVAPERRRYAAERLRKQSLTPKEEPSPLTAWPDVPSSYIICADDRRMDPGYVRRTARRLNVEPIVIPGSHSPFLARPAELAEVVIGLL